ncbi:MAG: hypothetical protein ACFFG0_01620 [Candidatus Thorarchaeota archaeon]
MATSSEILRQMINNVESQSENLESSITQVDEQIDDLTDQIDGVQNGMCAVAEFELTAYMDGTKVPALEILYGGMFTIPFVFTPGANYGTINYSTGGITDWTVKDDDGTTVYEYEGDNWDSDSIISTLISDYSFGNDYLTRPLTDGATYGLIPSKTNLETAKSILQENKDKIDASETAFEDYAS